MKLISHLKNIILEVYGPRIPVDKFNYGDNEIFLSASYHQWEERFGIKSFEEILDMYETDGLKYRFGVPNDMIKVLFKKNFGKIYDKFNQVESSSNIRSPRLNIIKDRKIQSDMEDNPEHFDFVEFIIQKNSQFRFEIVTSSFSKDGRYLKLFDKSKSPAPRLMVENKFYFDSTLII